MCFRRGLPMLALLLVTVGCESNPNAPKTMIDPASGEVLTEWPFWPEEMRIHPLTRLVTDDKRNRKLVEARVEFRDADGDVTKCLGQMEIQLIDGQYRDARAAPIARWSRDLGDLRFNRRHFDDVTRTYLFRLEIDEEKLPENVELNAYLLSANGQALRHERFKLRMNEAARVAIEEQVTSEE